MARFFTLILLAALGLSSVGCRSGSKHPKPDRITPPTPQAIEQSLSRGVAYLLASQNPNGSWGSATQTKDLNIYAPIPGAHQGFRAAVTSLCVMALIEAGGDDPKVSASIDKGEAWLVSQLHRVRRAEMEAVYNTWGHAYSIQALVRLLKRKPEDAARREKLLDIIRQQIVMLGKYEFVGGGWGYYDFEEHTQKPGGNPNSFTTATVLVALYEARGAGVEVPQKLIDAGLREINRQRNPNGTFVYSRNWQWRPTGVINRPGGSLGRNQSCNYVLRLFDDPTMTDKVFTTWLDRLFARNGWLDIGRKRPVPHESWFAVAGYFYYYGHYYGGLCMELLPERKRPFYQGHMAHTLMGRQEKDGSWFDYPFYAYHKPYGTAFAVMTLNRCKAENTATTAAAR